MIVRVARNKAIPSGARDLTVCGDVAFPASGTTRVDVRVRRARLRSRAFVIAAVAGEIANPICTHRIAVRFGSAWHHARTAMASVGVRVDALPTARRRCRCRAHRHALKRAVRGRTKGGACVAFLGARSASFGFRKICFATVFWIRVAVVESLGAGTDSALASGAADRGRVRERTGRARYFRTARRRIAGAYADVVAELLASATRGAAIRSRVTGAASIFADGYVGGTPVITVGVVGGVTDTG